jgi:hypothetical protein
MGFDQGFEVAFELILFQDIGWAVVEFADASHSPGIGFNSGFGFALAAQCAKMFTVQ